MISLTSRAAAQIRQMRTDTGAADLPLRLLVEEGGCSGSQYGMSFDARRDGDVLFESEGVPFILDPRSLSLLDGSVVDFDDGLQGRGFEIRNPNAKSTCGCGKSFN